MSALLGLGKVTREVFNRCVLPFIPIEKPIELDGAITSLRGNTVISHSPSIGVPIEALGFFAFHYSASNVASKFGRPSHLIIGIYLPLNSTEKDLKVISKSLGDEAKKYGVTITAGQTATYNGIQIPLLTATCIGKALLSPSKVKTGDLVLLAGYVGGEAVWLDMLSRDIDTAIWRNFTPLTVILSIQDIEGVKIIHDVSEGGVKGALFEILINNNFGLKVSSDTMKLYPGAERLNTDIFRAPSYGAFIIISDRIAVKEVEERCRDQQFPCSIIGEVTSNLNLVFDDIIVREQNRTFLDEIYGSFNRKP